MNQLLDRNVLVLRRIAVRQNESPRELGLSCVVRTFEPQLFIVIADQLILFRGNVISIELGDLALEANRHQRIEHSKLHAPLQYPAAHEPKLEMETAVLAASDNYRDEAVISEFVTQSTIQSDVVRIRSDSFNLR